MKRRHLPAVVAVAALALAACGSGDSATGEAALDPSKLTIYSAQHANLVDACCRRSWCPQGSAASAPAGRRA